MSELRTLPAFGGVGTDVGPLVQAGSAGAGLIVDSKQANYFYYHHTNADTPDKISQEDLKRAAAAMAVYAFCVANDTTTLPPNKK